MGKSLVLQRYLIVNTHDRQACGEKDFLQFFLNTSRLTKCKFFAN